jgi:hypothetical protein
MNFDLLLYRGLKIIGFGKSTVARRCFFFALFSPSCSSLPGFQAFHLLSSRAVLSQILMCIIPLHPGHSTPSIQDRLGDDAGRHPA